jgi:hypothetical protein
MVQTAQLSLFAPPKPPRPDGAVPPAPEPLEAREQAALAQRLVNALGES